jgi:hypothetical protein
MGAGEEIAGRRSETKMPGQAGGLQTLIRHGEAHGLRCVATGADQQRRGQQQGRAARQKSAAWSFSRACPACPDSVQLQNRPIHWRALYMVTAVFRYAILIHNHE